MADPDFSAVEPFLKYWQGLPRPDGAHAPPLEAFLDNVEPTFQPYVALVDVVDVMEWRMRLFGTARVESFGRDLFGVNPLVGYDPTIRDMVVENVQKVIHQPCGWVTAREVTTVTGVSNSGTAITLPLATGDGQPPCIANYTVMTRPLAHKDRTGQVDAITGQMWIDIGAGIPEE